MKPTRRLRAQHLIILAGAATLVVTAACKETMHTSEDGGDQTSVPAKRKTKPQFYAADATYLQKDSDFYFQVWNDTFSRKLDDLPMTGEVPDDHKPYTGGYYPQSNGGTDHPAVAGDKSPLQKYDDAFHGGQNMASAWEESKHTGGPSWAGHCNGFSASSQRQSKEPVKSVVRGGVTFTPMDIKALLAETHMNVDYQFLGGNRCDQEQTKYPDDRQDPTVRDDCEGVNPGTLHAAMANWIGRMHHTIIIDVYPNGQVWNYPLFKYQVTSKNYITAAQAAQYVDGGSTYKFNPSATQFALVTTRFTYVEATSKETLGQTLTKDLDLTYILEVDSDGQIVGGEWASGQTQQFHPGFIWVALEPMTPNGTPFMGNQYLDNDEVLKMWAESVGYDPNNFPHDLKRPAGSNTWGKWPGYDVTLDGTQTGAVFGGKSINLHIARHSNLNAAGISLDIALNGSPLKSITTTGTEEIKLALDPGIGLNRFEFTWKQGGTVLEDDYLRFHVVR